jgi:hypothetical protein
MLTRRAVAFAHCSSACRGLSAAGHNNPTLTRTALERDYTPLAHARGAVMRRAASVTGGLTVMSAYLPNVSVGSPCPVSSTRTPTTRI